MSEESPIYEQAVTTYRSAELLSKMHGFESVAMLAESLPLGAHVLDVGAGASPFGKEVATIRPDITWVNFDYSYNDAAILKEVSDDSPENVEHVAGDATNLNEIYEPETFDVVFSYWLMPHLSIDTLSPAKETAKSIFAITKADGLMSVGPKTNQKRLPSLKSGVAIQVIKDGTIDADTYADKIVSQTRLSKTARYTQRLANEVATPFFGTTRYTKGEGKIPHIYDPENGDYINPVSRKGVKIAGRLAIALANGVKNQRKSVKLQD